jgi:hypothetical protein
MTNWRSDLDGFIEETKAFVERASAKRRLADEYDAAQERGEVATGRVGPGIVRRALDEKLALGEEPTKAARSQIVADPNREREEIFQRIAVQSAPAPLLERAREFCCIGIEKDVGDALIFDFRGPCRTSS